MDILKDTNRKPGDSAEIICIICPNSCRLTVSMDDINQVIVEGEGCKRGIEYGKQEFLMPKRMLISTVRIKNSVLPVIPIRSNQEIPKERIFEAMEIINSIEIIAPVKMGHIIMENILNLGVNIITSRSMDSKI